MERMRKEFDGAAYKGEVDQEGRMSGFGVLVAENAAFASALPGEWREGLRWGHGTVVLPNGSKYEGEFENDQIHGLGKGFESTLSCCSATDYV
eukprot:scaffold897_cov402-Prasinococcus_capsulatus_cf.AAC.29